ncbi:MAG: hypothetical protein NC829_01095, partial [Candidatus Omnitrophica bacterium]|nr:hypothetical protein [Candidatus Omnitrophota bacterium]
VILKGLSMKALWQIEFFKRFGKKIILFLDEPYLGAFGSAYTALNREAVVRDLREIISVIKSQDVLVGIHCCGNTDWSIFTEVEAIDIISFDAFGFLERLILYAQEIKEFLERGGLLCWGIVPTQGFSSKITKDLLLKKLKDGIIAFKDKGVEEGLVRERMLLSPACGLGSLEIASTIPILTLLRDLAQDLK